MRRLTEQLGFRDAHLVGELGEADDLDLIVHCDALGAVAVRPLNVVVFAMMAGMAIHGKELRDEIFLRFLPVIAREALDERNFVKKAVNGALRQIGKRNPALRRAAIAEAKRIGKLDSRAARWIAADALRELG